jgi:hypothetical protein
MSTLFAPCPALDEHKIIHHLSRAPDLNDALSPGCFMKRTLPSGRSIVLYRARGFASEQWEMAGSGGLFRVQRPRRGNSAEYEFAKDGASRPLELTEEDARSLVTMLNDLLRESSERAMARRSAPGQRWG